MTNIENHPSEIVSRMISIYHQLVQDYQFERYEEFAPELDEMYAKLKQSTLTVAIHSDLAIVKELHEQLVQFILEDKNAQNRDIKKLGAGNRTVNPYTKLMSSTAPYFFDQKQ